jgi:threonine synthase
MGSTFRCIRCNKIIKPGTTFRCGCGGLYEVRHEFEEVTRELFDKRLGTTKKPYDSGVWRFKELVYPEIDAEAIVSRPEGNTNLYTREIVCDFVGVKDLSMKHEGENPTGSFKDRGMTVAVSEAKHCGASTVACASTGNTSASMAAYAAQSGLNGVVFVPEGEITYGKLSQALAYGAKVIQIRGNFDDAMRLVQEASSEIGYYLLNSLNPWRIEGQKTIIFELLQQRRWSPPDWIITPGGNLGNTSAFGKAISELHGLGLIEEKPRLAVVQAEGANPFYRLWSSKGKELEAVENPHTLASAIKIGAPVSWEKALRAVSSTGGVVEEVSDDEIMDAKAIVDRSGVGCEPASAASVAGARKLKEEGVIHQDDSVVCILTGNLLKDPDATIQYHTEKLQGIKARFSNKPVVIEPDSATMFQNFKKVIASTI